MPILQRENDLYPAALLGSDGAGDELWWAVHTKSRQEKKLMRQLQQLGIGFYGPLIARRRRAADGRVRTSHVPLFPGYVFVRGNEEQRRLAIHSNCVARTIEVHDRLQLIRDLQQVKRLIDTGARLTPESMIEAGQRVRVTAGPLAGIEGVVKKRHNGDHLIVVVGFLQQGASIAIADFQVEAI